VASLGLVSPEAATDGVTFFSSKKTYDLLYSSPLESDDLFSRRLLTTQGDTLQEVTFFVAEFRKKIQPLKIYFSRVSPGAVTPPHPSP